MQRQQLRPNDKLCLSDKISTKMHVHPTDDIQGTVSLSELRKTNFRGNMGKVSTN